MTLRRYTNSRCHLTVIDKLDDIFFDAVRVRKRVEYGITGADQRRKY